MPFGPSCLESRRRSKKRMPRLVSPPEGWLIQVNPLKFRSIGYEPDRTSGVLPCMTRSPTDNQLRPGRPRNACARCPWAAV